MIYNAFDKQRAFHKDPSRYRGLFAGKRAGKTETSAVEAIIHAENKPGFVNKGIDPYLGIIVAPTNDMLHGISVQKFMAYAKPFSPRYIPSRNVIIWDKDSMIKLVSADKPERLEGHKASWIWIDEVFQVKQQVFTEAVARVSDTRGKIWVSGSLGVQYNNPKKHWIYSMFKENPIEGSNAHEWGTVDNPYFPQDELTRLKDTLDPKTFRQLYELSWEVAPSNVVYEDLDDGNFEEHIAYNEKLPLYVAIDWGWNHPTACLFIQHDPRTDCVYVIDEICKSKMEIEELYNRIISKPYRINAWVCDIAGNQERELAGKSNVQWFWDAPRNIRFKYRKMGVNDSISLVRRYVQNGKGQKRLFISRKTCPVLSDQILNYSYQEKNGILLEEVIKKDDDAPDALRYFFGNILDDKLNKKQVIELNRWALKI